MTNLLINCTFVPPVQAFTSRSLNTPSTESNTPHFLRIQNVYRRFPSDKFYPRNVILGKRLWRALFPEIFNLNLFNLNLFNLNRFKLRITRYFFLFVLITFTSYDCLFPLYDAPHSSLPFNNNPLT